MKIFKHIAIGVIVALGGLFFAENFSALLNGLDRNTMRVLLMNVYFIVVVIVCSGLILDKTKGDKNE